MEKFEEMLQEVKEIVTGNLLFDCGIDSRRLLELSPCSMWKSKAANFARGLISRTPEKNISRTLTASLVWQRLELPLKFEMTLLQLQNNSNKIRTDWNVIRNSWYPARPFANLKQFRMTQSYHWLSNIHVNQLPRDEYFLKVRMRLS